MESYYLTDEQCESIMFLVQWELDKKDDINDEHEFHTNRVLNLPKGYVFKDGNDFLEILSDRFMLFLIHNRNKNVLKRKEINMVKQLIQNWI